MIREVHRRNPVPLPLLITGLAGVPGFNAWHYFRQKYPGQVIGIRQADNDKINGPDVVPCNAEDHDGLARLFDQYEFRAVLDCAGNCALKQCEVAPEIAWRINVEGLQNLVAQTAPRGLRLVHLSCDLVFSGEKIGDGVECGGYVEDDPTDPVTMYGKNDGRWRAALARGRPDGGHLANLAADGRERQRPCGCDRLDHVALQKEPSGRRCTIDEIRSSPTYTDYCMNRLYETMLGNDLSGIFHAGGPRRLTLYQIAQVINRVGGYNPDCVFGVPRSTAAPIPPRAGNVCMNSEKLVNALGLRSVRRLALLRLARPRPRRLAPRPPRRFRALPAPTPPHPLPQSAEARLM